MRAFVATMIGSLVALCATSTAYAEGQISDIRFGKQPDAERIVLDLGADPVDATQSSTDDRFVLEMAATKPQLALEKEDRLADMKIFFEDAPGGSRLVVDKANRPVQVFRILAAPGSGKGDRLVVDVGRAGGRDLEIPRDAARVPVRGTAVASVKPTPAPAVEPTPAPEPPPVTRTPEPPPAPREEPKRSKPEGSLLNGMEPQAKKSEPDVGAKPTPPPAPVPPRRELSEQQAPAPDGEKEDVWVLVRAIEIQGVSGDAPSLQDLQELKLAVSPVRGGYVAPRDNAPVQRLPLRALVGDDRDGRRLSGSVLQLIVETIAAEYTRNEKLGTRVDIRRADLEGLMQGGDGRLVIRVREMPARAAGSAEN
jgi:hypothetical protein